MKRSLSWINCLHPPVQPAEPLKLALAHQSAASAHLEKVGKEASQALLALLALVATQTQNDSALRERDALQAVLAAPERKTKQGDVNQNALNTHAERYALEARVLARQRVIFDAFQRHQVLVFTCHPAAWRNVGASLISIAM